MVDQGTGGDPGEPTWEGDSGAKAEVLEPGAALAAWAGLFGLLPHRFTPTPGRVRVTPSTWRFGLASWGLLLTGAPLVRASAVGLLGALLELLAFACLVLFVTRILLETATVTSPRRPVGIAGLLLAALIVLAAAWGPVGLFGQEPKRMAEAKYHLKEGEAPTPTMIREQWWEAHSWFGLVAVWLAALALPPLSLWLLGVTSIRELAIAGVAGGVTGPLLLAVCSALLGGS